MERKESNQTNKQIWQVVVEIPWLFPDFFQNFKFHWLISKFPDFSLTLNFFHFSLTFPWPWEPCFGAFDDRRIWFIGSLPSCNAFVSTLVRTHLLRDIWPEKMIRQYMSRWDKLASSDFCCLLIAFANSLYSDQTWHSVGSDLGQTLCIGYQQITKVATSKERIKLQTMIMHLVGTLIQYFRQKLNCIKLLPSLTFHIIIYFVIRGYNTWVKVQNFQNPEL